MPALKADLMYFSVVNFAMQQNKYRYIQKIAITNTTDYRIDNVWLTLSFEPQFAENISIRVGTVMPGQIIELGQDHFDINLSFDFLVGLTESVKGYNVIDLYSGETLVYHEKYDVNVLTLEECPWCMLPELIAAFVMPNHPVLSGVLRRASEILDDSGEDSSLSGYQKHKKEFVIGQIMAVYLALQELEITYISAPPSFFCTGQRVRLVDDIITNRLGTCFDTAILFASCFEAIDLDPLIICTTEHAFVGCFLEEDVCHESIINDIDYLVEMFARAQIFAVETTAITKGKDCEFEDAVESAMGKVRKALSEGGFEFAVNIKQLRKKQKVLPIPLRIVQKYWNNSNQLTTLPTHPAALPGNRELTIYNDDLYYIYLDNIIYGPYLLDQMQDLPLLPDTLITTNRLNGEWYEAKDFACFANKFRMIGG